MVQEEMASFGEESVNVNKAHNTFSLFVQRCFKFGETNEKALKSSLHEQQLVLHHNRCLDGHAGVSIFMIN